MLEFFQRLFGAQPEIEPVSNFDALIKDQIRRDEGEVLHAYQDSLGYWTIGVGRLIDKRKSGGISKREADYLLQNDLDRIMLTLAVDLPWTDDLDETRRGVLVNMAFQMGMAGLKGFKNTLTMIERGDYAKAADNMLLSKWARQTPARAKRMSEQMRTGVWQ